MLTDPGTQTCLLDTDVPPSASSPLADSSSCVHGLQCGDGSCVWDSQWCDGVRHCPAGQDEDNCGKHPLSMCNSAI